MSRYRRFDLLDEQAAAGVDAGFLGVDMRRDPNQLEPGFASEARNKDFVYGVAATRPALQSVGWGQEYGTCFPLDFDGGCFNFFNFEADVFSLTDKNYRIYNGTTLQLLNPTTNEWHAIWIEMVNGIPSLAIDQNGITDWVYAEFNEPDANFRIVEELTLQIFAPETNRYHSIWIEDMAGVPVLAIDQNGMLATDPVSPPLSQNYGLNDGKTLELQNVDTESYHAIWVEEVAGVPLLSINQDGYAEKGICFGLTRGFGEVFGCVEFSDPYGQEAGLIAVASGVWMIRQGMEPAFIRLPDGIRLDAPVHMIQAFEKVLMFRGDGNTTLEWDSTIDFTNNFASFSEVTQTPVRGTDPDNTYGDGAQIIPESSFAMTFNNRVLVKRGRDEVAVSDILDYTRYSTAQSLFRINSGTDDNIVAMFPWNETTVIVFKDQSIYFLGNFFGDLSTTYVDLLTREYGCIAPLTPTGVGSDVWFFSEGGVFSIRQVLENKLQASTLPISAPIQPIIDRMNWNFADKAVAAYHDNRFVLSAPFDGANYNNGLVVYNFLTGAWSGLWKASFLDVMCSMRLNYGGRRSLFFVGADNLDDIIFDGSLVALVPDYEDYVYGTFYDIEDYLLTRGYPVGSLEQKSYMRVLVDQSTWCPEFSLARYTDGVNERDVYDTDKTKSRVKYYTFGVPDFNATNANFDHGNPWREDYSVDLGSAAQICLGSAGVCINRTQRVQESYRVRGRGVFMQVEVSNKTGHVRQHSILCEAKAGARGYRVKV